MKRQSAYIYGFILFHCRFTCSFTTTYSDQRLPVRFIRTFAFASSAGDEFHHRLHQEQTTIIDLLRKYGYDRRVVTLQSNDLPLVAELYENGESNLVSLEEFIANEKDDAAEPKVLIRFMSEQDGKDRKVVSFNDITTIWNEHRTTDLNLLSLDKIQQQLRTIRASRIERAFDRLYSTRVGTSRSSSKGINKKQVSLIAQQHFSHDGNAVARVELLLRQVIKAGVGSSRLVASDTVQSLIYKTSQTRQQSDLERAVASYLISQDAADGGRFKRFPCMVVKADANGEVVYSLTVINGGWLVTDQSVRASSEGRQFAERSQDMNEAATTTMADERIIRRLECLALGESFSTEELQVDVRDTLKALGLPVTRKGASEALVRIGRWTGNEDLSKLAPWSTEVLQAASWFVQWKKNHTKAVALKEGRTDLTQFPTICIDAKRAAFRDDAIGIRPRAATCRRVIPEASKWEMLVHVIDTSSIYGQHTEENGPLTCLKHAAASRVLSRYDLPQPLHLMPPRVLRALSFSAESNFHCCVTLWVYIDERNGKIIDAGLERTLVGTPNLKSFDEATSIMDELSLPSSDLRSVLLVLERNLSMWSERHLEHSDVARKREAKLVAREQEYKDDSWDEVGACTGSFQRSRGHRLVDSALDLHGIVLYNMLRQSNAPIPMTVGAEVTRGGRMATAPLRRFVDGMAQRQALAALCHHGRRLTLSECRKAGKLANDARNTFTRIRARKRI
ncbi:hypothetical protein MPSEU_000892200 [Mayamaea pseudoterrestris]|nr:hypothetical protein MPSEU_000892200 [Mayamaea pseudoterrestris]